MPLDDLLAASLRVVGALFVALGVWIFTTPSAEPDDKFEDYVFDHVDAVRDLFDDARDRLMRDDVATIDERVCRHAEVRSEEHTSELQSLMRISYAVCCLKIKK